MIIAPAGGNAGRLELGSTGAPGMCWGGADGDGDERVVACSALAGRRWRGISMRSPDSRRTWVCRAWASGGGYVLGSLGT
jgi:hypothetical protein